MIEPWVEQVMSLTLCAYTVAILFEGLTNKCLIQCCFVDTILFLMIQLRLFNGYMQDDYVLSLFCESSGYIEKINERFSGGITEARRELRQRKAREGVEGKNLPTISLRDGSPSPTCPRRSRISTNAFPVGASRRPGAKSEAGGRHGRGERAEE